MVTYYDIIAVFILLCRRAYQVSSVIVRCCPKLIYSKVPSDYYMLMLLLLLLFI